jgi:hypothetical protein
MAPAAWAEYWAKLAPLIGRPGPRHARFSRTFIEAWPISPKLGLIPFARPRSWDWFRPMAVIVNQAAKFAA